jgi:hypothetical protein
MELTCQPDQDQFPVTRKTPQWALPATLDLSAECRHG